MNVEQVQDELHKLMSRHLGEKATAVSRAAFQASVSAFLDGLKRRGKLPVIVPVVHTAAEYEVDGSTLTWISKEGYRWTEDRIFGSREEVLRYAQMTLHNSLVCCLVSPTVVPEIPHE